MFRKFQISNCLPNRYFSQNCRWVPLLLLSVVCRIALIHVELKIQEHHRVISQSATFCGQLEKEILHKVQKDYERWQINKGRNSDGAWHETQGKVNSFELQGGGLPYLDYSLLSVLWDSSWMGDFFHLYYTCFLVGCQEMTNVKAELPIKKGFNAWHKNLF